MNYLSCERLEPGERRVRRDERRARADERLQRSDLQYTIIRPGSLTDEEGRGRSEAAETLGRRGEISRDDVARTLAAALDAENTYHKTFEILGGDTPIREALARI